MSAILGLLLAIGAAAAQEKPAPARNIHRPKLTLTTDYGGELHWRRLIDFAKHHDVERLLYWSSGEWKSSKSRPFPPPWTYPRRPSGILSQEARQSAENVQKSMRRSAKMTAEAGLKFWYEYNVLMLPAAEQLKRAAPELFNEHGEPDMSGDAIYAIIDEQLNELHELVPDLEGMEVALTECAETRVENLRHQSLSLQEIVDRVVAAVHANCRKHRWKMTLNLHAAGGHRRMTDALSAAAKSRPDIIVTADNVIGDFSLCLPFNQNLREAAKTNPISVNFDLNGEYWGRNFVPTSALRQYEAHLEEARRLGAESVNGRVGTVWDVWNPHENILPRYRNLYPPFTGKDLQICSTDTLGRMNALFFCRRANDPAAAAERTVRDFLVAQFGEQAAALTPAFLKIENVDKGIFAMDGNYFLAQSIRRGSWICRFWGLREQMILPAGTPFPTPEMRKTKGLAGFAGWPVPLGHRAAGPKAILAEKTAALRGAEELLREVQSVADKLKPADRAFLVRQFEDLVFFARIYRWITEAEIHALLIQRQLALEGLPDRPALKNAVQELRRARAEWLERYPQDPWGLHNLIDDTLKLAQQP
ncbi:MAG: hypothetical protein IT426_08785 [Pirellulales bacterium]|nr:hypothetical protein [Pirellulales bacterium]